MIDNCPNCNDGFVYVRCTCHAAYLLDGDVCPDCNNTLEVVADCSRCNGSRLVQRVEYDHYFDIRGYK